MEQSKGSSVGNTQDEIDLIELLLYLKKKWVVLAAALLAGIMIAGVGTKFLIHPKYSASSKLYVVSASGKSVVNLDDLRLGTSLSSDYAELIKIRPICNEIIKDLNLDYTVSQLKKMISVEAIVDTRILNITVVSESPEEAKDIANAVADKAVTYLPKLMEITPPNIAEEAITPVNPTSPSLTKNAMLGGLLALLLAAGIYTVLFLKDDTIKTAEDIEKLLGVMPLTVILEHDGLKKKKQELHRR